MPCLLCSALSTLHGCALRSCFARHVAARLRTAVAHSGGAQRWRTAAAHSGSLRRLAVLWLWQLVDEAWNTVSLGINRLTVVAGQTVATVATVVKPGLQEVSQRYQRGELAGTAAQLVATGADYGLRGLSSLKGLLKSAVSQLEGAADDGRVTLILSTRPALLPGITSQRQARLGSSIGKL